jgi:hypothetical protein
MAEYEVKGIVWASTRTYLIEPAERIVELFGIDVANAEPWRKTVYEVWKHIKDGNAYFVTRPDTAAPVYLVPADARPRYVKTPPDETGRDNLVALGEPHGQLARMLCDVLSAKSLAILCSDLDLPSEGTKQAKAERIVELVGTFEVLVLKLDEGLLRAMCNAYAPGFAGSRAEMTEFLRRRVNGQELAVVRQPPGLEPASAAREEKPAPTEARAESAPPAAPSAPEPPKQRVAISPVDFHSRLAAMFERWRRAPAREQKWAPMPELPLVGWWELKNDSSRALLPVFDSDLEVSRALIGGLCERLGGDRSEQAPEAPGVFEWVPAPLLSRFLAAFQRLRLVPVFHAAAPCTVAEVIEVLEQAAAIPDKLPPLRELERELRLYAPLSARRRELAERIRSTYFSARFRALAEMLEAAAFED